MKHNFYKLLLLVSLSILYTHAYDLSIDMGEFKSYAKDSDIDKNYQDFAPKPRNAKEAQALKSIKAYVLQQIKVPDDWKDQEPSLNSRLLYFNIDSKGFLLAQSSFSRADHFGFEDNLLTCYAFYTLKEYKFIGRFCAKDSKLHNSQDKDFVLPKALQSLNIPKHSILLLSYGAWPAGQDRYGFVFSYKKDRLYLRYYKRVHETNKKREQTKSNIHIDINDLTPKYLQSLIPPKEYEEGDYIEG